MTAQAKDNKGMAIASLVLGIVTLVVWIVAPLTGILAVIFGVLGLRSTRRGMAIAGIITGALGALIIGAIMALTFIALPALQQAQRDTNRKQDASELSSQITTYMSMNQGQLPTADTIEIGDSAFVQKIASAGDPTTDTIVYTTGEDCDGVQGARAYSIRVLLESGSEYCVGS